MPNIGGLKEMKLLTSSLHPMTARETAHGVMLDWVLREHLTLAARSRVRNAKDFLTGPPAKRTAEILKLTRIQAR